MKKRICYKRVWPKYIAKQMKKNSKKTKHIYYCKSCGGYHVTSKSWTKKRNMRASAFYQVGEVGPPQELEIKQAPDNLMALVNAIVLAIDKAWRARVETEQIIEASKEKQRTHQ